jgi:hypothetical protein
MYLTLLFENLLKLLRIILLPSLTKWSIVMFNHITNWIELLTEDDWDGFSIQQKWQTMRNTYFLSKSVRKEVALEATEKKLSIC